jgi:homoserine acetyltransferase
VWTQFETKFSVGSYLAYQGDRFGERFDPNSYLTLTMAIDLFDLGERELAGVPRSECRWLMMSFTSDWLFPPFQTQEMVDALLAEGKPSARATSRPTGGHDAFAAEPGAYLRGMMRVFGEFGKQGSKEFLCRCRICQCWRLKYWLNAMALEDASGTR